MRKSQQFILPGFFSVLLILSFTFFKRGDTTISDKDPVPDPLKENYAIFPVSLPDKLEFSGEDVPLDQVDVREGLDREILVNTYFQSQTLLYIKRANRYFPIVEPILKKYEIPVDFKFLAVAESGLTQAISPAQAVGFWQLLEGTAKEYGLEVTKEVDERYHIEKSTEAACKYLKDSYEKYGNWTMAAASYNAGRNGIDKQVSRQKESDYYDLLLGEETERYIYRILAYKLILSNPGNYGFHLGEDDLYTEIPTFEVTIDAPVESFATFAKRYDISYKILKWFNPWLRDEFLTNREGKSYYVKIPRKGYFDPRRPDQDS